MKATIERCLHILENSEALTTDLGHMKRWDGYKISLNNMELLQILLRNIIGELDEHNIRSGSV